MWVLLLNDSRQLFFGEAEFGVPEGFVKGVQVIKGSVRRCGGLLYMNTG
jgi:hypothetical protein